MEDIQNIGRADLRPGVLAHGLPEANRQGPIRIWGSSWKFQGRRLELQRPRGESHPGFVKLHKHTEVLS